MCKDNDMGLLMTKIEIQEILKLTNASFGMKTGDIYSIQFDQFPEFLV